MSLAEAPRDTAPGRWQALADRVLAGGAIDRDEARAILDSSDVELLDVLAAESPMQPAVAAGITGILSLGGIATEVVDLRAARRYVAIEA